MRTKMKVALSALAAFVVLVALCANVAPLRVGWRSVSPELRIVRERSRWLEVPSALRQSSCDVEGINTCTTAFNTGPCSLQDLSDSPCCQSLETYVDCLQPLVENCPNQLQTFNDIRNTFSAACKPGSTCDLSRLQGCYNDAYGGGACSSGYDSSCCDVTSGYITCLQSLISDCPGVQTIVNDLESVQEKYNKNCKSVAPSASSSASPSPSPSPSPSASGSATPTPSSSTPTPTPSSSTGSETPTLSPTESSSASASPSASQSSSESVSPSPSPTPSSSGGGGGDGGEKKPSPTPTPETICFPADAVAELEDGRRVAMHELKIGDSVRVSPKEFSDVFMFSHQDRHVKTTMVRIDVDARRDAQPLELSPSHYVRVVVGEVATAINGGDKPPRRTVLVAASSVQEGDVLQLADGKFAQVSAVRRVLKEGLFNPQTLHGDIVVNNVVVSTFTQAVKPWVARLLLLLPRVLYQLGLHAPLRMLSQLLAGDHEFVAYFVPAGSALIASA